MSGNLDYIDKSKQDIVNELKSLKERIKELEDFEREYHKNTQKYDVLYENNSSMYFTVDSNGNVLSVNEYGLKKLGYSYEELVGKPVLNVFYEEDKKSVKEQFDKCLDNPGNFYEWEFRKVKKNGDIIWVKEVAKTVVSDEGNTFVIIDCRDITSLKNTENQLRDTVEKLTTKTRYEELINTISQVIHKSINSKDILEDTADAIINYVDPVDMVSIYLVENDIAIIKVHRGAPNWYIEKVGHIPKGRGFTWKTIENGKLNYSADVDKDDVIGAAGILLGIKSYISIPIKLDELTIGVINVTSFKKNAFNSEDLSMFNMIANQVSMAIKNAKQADELQYTHNILELRVKERTLELLKSNALLREEIEKRIRAEKEIKKSLQEKELLLKELQHRVKNNLQVIVSMLDLQTNYINDKVVSEMFVEAQKRVKSMALVHEHMYQSEVLTDLDFNQYIENLTNYLFKIYGYNSELIGVNIEIKENNIKFNKAILLGLIINEIVSNSLKYAFPNSNQKGIINIRLVPDGDQCILTAADNGIGLPKNFRLRQTKTLGLQLVLALTKQLRGNITIYRKKGTRINIKFPH